MAVSLVIFYAPGRSASNIDPTRNTEVVAKVGSATITVADVARIRENYAQMFGGRINLAQLGWEQALSRRPDQQASDCAGSRAARSQRQRRRTRERGFANNLPMLPDHFVGFERYKESVTARYGDIEKFEDDIRDEIAQEKLRAFVSASVNVSDAGG